MPKGGYLWWYVDALSDDGRHGLSIIAFVGSVFSPYYASARKRGGAVPDNHCAINVALYGAAGRRWSMTERGQRSVQREARRFAVGPSSVRWEHDALVLDLDEISVPIPRRIRGQVRVMPSGLSSFVTALDSGGLHRWGPIAPCARVEVALESPAQRWSGHGYLDSNEGDEPIDRPFREWDWSRSSLRDGSTAVLYDVQPKTGPDRVLALRFGRGGDVQSFEPPPRQALPSTMWRLPCRMRGDSAVAVQVEQTLEDAPFYSRAVLRSSLLGETVTSVHETLNVPRLVSTATQWMLPWRMPRRA